MQGPQAGQRRHVRFGNRARRSTALLLAAVLCLTMAGCEDGDDPDTSTGGDGTETGQTPSPPPPEDTAESISELIEQGAREWLSGFASTGPLECPGSSDATMVASDSAVQACTYFTTDQAFHVQVQNLSTVPISVWGRPDVDPVHTVLPLATLDLVITHPEFGQYLSYQAETVAGLTSVVVEQVQSELNEKLVPGYGWVECAAKPEADCLLSGLAGMLPKTVVIRGHEIPLRLLANGLALTYQNQDLLDSFAGDFAGQPPGTLTITRAG